MASANIILRAQGLNKINSDAKRARTGILGLGKSADKASTSLRNASVSSKGFSTALRAVGTAIAAIGFAILARGFISVATKFEQLRIRLRTFTKDQKEFNSEWERFISVAATTQVDLDQLIAGMITLRTVGLNPTTEEVQRLADVAAATGLTFEQLTNIIFRGTSSTELFYQAGITARVEGEKLRVTYLGVTTVIQKNSAAIKDYLVDIARSNGYTGAAEKVAKGLTGALSNLSGNWKALVDQVGITSGLTQKIADRFANLALKFETLRKRITETGSVWFALSSDIRIAAVTIAGFTAIALTAKAFSAWKSLRSGISAAAAAMRRFTLALIANPIGLIITGIIVVVLALVAVFVYFREEVSTVVAKVAGFIYERMLNIKSIFDHLLPNALETLANGFGEAFDYISEKVAQARDYVIEKLSEMSETFALVVGYIKQKAGEIGFSLDIGIPDTLLQAFAEDKIAAEEWAASVKIATNNALLTLEDFYKMSKRYITQGIFGTTSATDIPAEEFSGSGVRPDRPSPTGVNSPFLNPILTAFDPSNPEFGGAIEQTKSLGEMFADAFVEGLEAQTSSVMNWVANINEAFATGVINNGEVLTLSLGKTFGELSKFSKRAFDLNKGLQIVSATIDTYKAFTTALAGPIPPPFSYAIAAGALAAGLAKVAAIRSQKFNPPRRFGGNVTAGLPGLVGENGPEYIIPKQNSTIIPTNRADAERGGFGDGGGNTYIVNTQIGPGAKPGAVTDSIGKSFAEMIDNGGLDLGGGALFRQGRVA